MIANTAASLTTAGSYTLDKFRTPVFSPYVVFASATIPPEIDQLASAHMKAGEQYTLNIDLKPALDEQKLDLRILRDFEQYQNRDLENALKDLYPKTMIPVIIARAGLDPSMKVNAFTKQQRRKLLELTKCFPVAVAGPRPVEEAIVTAGGISVKEIDPRTMESKCVQGLYFAGEVMDLDAYTGGFNLQIAWATGYAAGTAAGQPKFE